MEKLIVSLLIEDSILFTATLGGIAGAAAGAVGYLLGSLFTGDEGKRMISTVLVVAAALTLPDLVMKPMLKDIYKAPYEKEGTEKVMDQIAGYRVFALIFENDPAARDEFEDRMAEIISSATPKEAYSLAQAEGAKLVGKHYNAALPDAPDEMIGKVLDHNLENLRSFEDNHRLCVTYFLGAPQFKPGEIDEDFLKAESDLKADVIESAINDPTPPKKADSMEEIAEILIAGYEDKDYAPEHLDMIGQLTQIPPSMGCEIAIEFSDVLASLDPARAAFVLKNLGMAGGQPL